MTVGKKEAYRPYIGGTLASRAKAKAAKQIKAGINSNILQGGIVFTTPFHIHRQFS